MRCVCSLGFLFGLLVALTGCSDKPQKAPEIEGGGLGFGKSNPQVSTPKPPPTETRKSGAELLEKVIKAHGGLDNLKKFKNIQIEAEGWTMAEPVGKTTCTRESIFSYPDRARHRWVLDTRPERMIFVAALNGGTGWIKNAKNELTPFSNEYVTQLQLENQLDWFPYLFITQEPNFNFYLCEVPDIDKKKMLGLAIVQGSRHEVQLFIDPDTNLVRGLQTTLPVLNQPLTKFSMVYGDHKEVVGAKLPHKLLGFHNGEARFELRLKALRPVEEVDANLFDATKN